MKALIAPLIVTLALGFLPTASALVIDTNPYWIGQDTGGHYGSGQTLTVDTTENYLIDLTFYFDADSAGHTFDFFINDALNGGNSLFYSAIDIVEGANTILIGQAFTPGSTIFAQFDYRGFGVPSAGGQSTHYIQRAGIDAYPGGFGTFGAVGSQSIVSNVDLRFVANFRTSSGAQQITIDPAEFSSGTDVSTAYSGVTLFNAQGSFDAVDDGFGNLIHSLPLTLTGSQGPVYTVGGFFGPTSGDDLWSAGPCCGRDDVLRVDFLTPATFVQVLFSPTDNDTGYLQAYDANDNLLLTLSQNDTSSFTLSYAAGDVPVAYILATYADTGNIGEITYSSLPIPPDDFFEVLLNSIDNILDITANDFGFIDPAFVTIISPPDAGGAAMVNNTPGPLANTNVTYTPPSGFTGPETFTYQIEDIEGTTETAMVTISVTEALDTDNDGVPDAEDNCIDAPNGPLMLDPDDEGISQRDTDDDGQGDACDDDDDNDGLTDAEEANLGTDRLDADTDDDGVDDGLDVFPLDPNEWSDTDSDGIGDNSDNCIEVANGPLIPDAGGNSQYDSNGDGFGNMCDADLNNDGVVNGLDVGSFIAAFGSTDPDADFNGTGFVNGLDVGPFVSGFGKAPGPSALAP